MKNKVALILTILIIASGCKYFEKKKLFSKGADTLINYAEDLNNTNTEDTAGMGEIPEDEVTTPSENDVRYGSAQTLSNKKAYMIVGCFLIPQNADRYALKMRDMGYNSEIIQGYNGFHMVAVNAYDNVRTGISDISKYRSEVNQNAWLFVRR